MAQRHRRNAAVDHRHVRLARPCRPAYRARYRHAASAKRTHGSPKPLAIAADREPARRRRPAHDGCSVSTGFESLRSTRRRTMKRSKLFALAAAIWVGSAAQTRADDIDVK